MSFGFEATKTHGGRVPQMKPSASSRWFLISGHANELSLQWFRWGLFSFPYVLPPIKDVNNYNPNWHILGRSWSSPALNFFKNSLFHSPANSSKYGHRGDRRNCLYSLTGCPYQAGWIYKNVKAFFPSWDKANCRSVIIGRARWGSYIKTIKRVSTVSVWMCV